jgi:hypothetical protein
MRSSPPTRSVSKPPILARYNCPICGVETTPGRTCGYHARRRELHERTAPKHRFVRYWIRELGALIDEAREA